MLGKVKTSLLFLMIFAVSCIDENENLVNPPSQAETIYIRLINYTSDGKSRVLRMEDGMETSETAAGSVSEAIHPPTDSSFISIIQGGSQDYKTENRVRFARGITYTYFALPTPDGAPVERAYDTLISLTTSTTIPDNSVFAYLKLFNAYPDSTVTFSLRMGCPNGSTIFSNVNYRKSSLMQSVRSGTVGMSLVMHELGTEVPLGLFRFDLDKRAQYAFIVARGQDGEPELRVLTQADYTTNAIAPAEFVTERTTLIRAVNFSDSPIDVAKLPDEVIAQGLPSNNIGEYVEVSACGSQYQDSILATLSPSSATASLGRVSLEVLRRYTVLVFDTPEGTADNMMIFEPLDLEIDQGDNALVRVIHASQEREGVTVSLGARPDMEQDLKFSSGEILANKIHYGNISEAVLLKPGPAPIAIFTSFEPRQLLFCAFTELEPGKRYFLVLTNNEAGEDKIALIEDDAEDLPSEQISFLEQGVFTEVVNAVSGVPKVSLSLDNSKGIKQLENSELFFTESLATIVSEGENTIVVNGIQKKFNVAKDKRALIIATGTGEETEILTFINAPLGADLFNLRRRFINASKDPNYLTVKLNSNDTAVVPAASYIEYGSYSPPETVTLEQKASIFFIDAELDEQVRNDPDEDVRTSSTVLRIDDISMPFGKNYSIIFTGDPDNGYAAIIQQEF